MEPAFIVIKRRALALIHHDDDGEGRDYRMIRTGAQCRDSISEGWLAKGRRRLLAFAPLAAVYRNSNWDGPLDFARTAAGLSDRMAGKGAPPAMLDWRERSVEALAAPSFSVFGDR